MSAKRVLTLIPVVLALAGVVRAEDNPPPPVVPEPVPTTTAPPAAVKPVKPAKKTVTGVPDTVNRVAQPPVSSAAPLRPLLERLLANSHRIAGAQHQQAGADAGLSKARAGWWGDVTFNAAAGRENTVNPGATANTRVPTREAGVTLRQPLLDFGRIGGDIDKAKLSREQAELTYTDTTQDVLLDGLTALINVDRARKVAEYSQQSVRNIERQTGMEESRVELGGGYATDVLQAKSQLAGANARLSRAKGTVVTATNRFQALFHEPPPVQIAAVSALPKALPKTLEEAVRQARARNPQLEIARLGVEVAKAEVRRVRGAELAPRVEGVVDYSAKHNVSGTLGEKDTQTYKVQVTMPFNLGFSAMHSIDQANAGARAAQSALDERRLTLDQQVADAWQNLATARETYDFFDNQIRIAAEFLELARVERQQGRRSLIDVLSGETSLFNARADAVAAQGDVAIAAFSLLRAMGVLEIGVVK